ncbi:MAG: hypothetical protein IT292_08950 [Deltaproteobacteria bacterium]|nr:hypothetical protein [Deltaproteobacteria bacterium]
MMGHSVIIVIFFEALGIIRDTARLKELKEFLLEYNEMLFDDEQLWSEEEEEEEEWKHFESVVAKSHEKERYIPPPSAEDLADSFLQTVGLAISEVSGDSPMEELPENDVEFTKLDGNEDNSSYCNVDFNAEGNAILSFEKNEEAIKFLKRWVGECEGIFAYVQGPPIELSDKALDFKALNRSTKEHNRLEKELRQIFQKIRRRKKR